MKSFFMVSVILSASILGSTAQARVTRTEVAGNLPKPSTTTNDLQEYSDCMGTIQKAFQVGRLSDANIRFFTTQGTLTIQNGKDSQFFNKDGSCRSTGPCAEMNTAKKLPSGINELMTLAVNHGQETSQNHAVLTEMLNICARKSALSSHVTGLRSKLGAAPAKPAPGGTPPARQR